MPGPNGARCQKPVEIWINGTAYKRVITKVKGKQTKTKGSSIFYSTDSSDTPYLIIVHDTHFTVEYSLVSLADTKLPDQLFLRLSQAVLDAHKKDIVIGPCLERGNIRHEVSLGNAGLPSVTFKNLPPPTSLDVPPPLPPNCAVPGLGSDQSGATKESDIYCTPLVLFQIVQEIENLLDLSKQHVSLLAGTQQVVYSNFSSPESVPLPLGEPTIPAVIEANKPLLRIVKKCLSPQPSRRPTAAALCSMLLRLCRSHIASSALLDFGKLVLTGFKKLTPWP
ncbi:hypothetical protein B0H34DRAFT_796578 [Crassisporium funariophilum]|nr:hypothetical protein B0H34DRAFT_796578 [Crassisporium funariophilum]